jgi:hypothetical protein
MRIYRVFAAGAAALLAFGTLSAQDVPAKVVEPEYNFIVFALDSANGSLIPLERKQSNMQTKVRAMGFGGAKGSRVFPGESSPVRFKADQKIEFIMRLDSTDTDPSTLVVLEALTRSKGKRELQIVQVGAFGTHSGTTNGQAAKSLNFARYGEHSYRFTPAEPLSKGKYAVMSKGSTESFLFGVD